MSCPSTARSGLFVGPGGMKGMPRREAEAWSVFQDSDFRGRDGLDAGSTASCLIRNRTLTLSEATGLFPAMGGKTVSARPSRDRHSCCALVMPATHIHSPHFKMQPHSCPYPFLVSSVDSGRPNLAFQGLECFRLLSNDGPSLQSPKCSRGDASEKMAAIRTTHAGKQKKKENTTR